MRAAAALAAVVAAACFGGPPRGSTPAELGSGIAAALRGGDLQLADDVLARGRAAHPRDGSLRLWAALLAGMRGEDLVCLSHYQALVIGADRGGLGEADLHGRMGELLFRLGRWGEAVQPLRRGLAGEAADLRRALLEMAIRLPWQRPQPARTAAELPLVESSLPELVCTVGGRQRAFVLDTGANWTTLSASTAAELGVEALTSAGLATDGTGHRFEVQVGLLHDFALGDIALGPLPVMVVDDARLTLRDRFGGAPRQFTGLIGLDVLRWFRITFDPQRRSVFVQQRQDRPTANAVPSLRVEGGLLVGVRIEGRPFWFAMDTGASHSSLTPAGLAALPGGAQRATETFRPVRSPGGRRIAVRQVEGLTLRVSGAQFAGVTLPIVERVASAFFPVHGVLGADLLLRCRTTIDRAQVLLELPD